MLKPVVNGGDYPGKAKPKEHIDGVGPSDVSDGRVSVLRVDGGCPGGECVRQRCAEGDECDGGYRLLDAQFTTKHGGELCDDGSDDTDEEERDDERPESMTVASRWDQGEEHLPADGEEVHDGFRRVRHFDDVVLIDGRSKHARDLELLQPADLLLLEEVVDPFLLDFIGSDQLVIIGDDLDVAHVLSGNPDSFWPGSI